MEDIRKLLGKRIKELRKYNKMSQEKLAEVANIEQRSLSHIECGDTFPSRSLLDIAKALNIELKELFDFEHLEMNSDNMKKYIVHNIEQLNDSDIKTVYRIIKSMK
ncbi:helix-turn-helix transcriptional regulator [bacterium]|nr:helix-turn-helix transcriptional regulator [bacterium]